MIRRPGHDTGGRRWREPSQVSFLYLIAVVAAIAVAALSATAVYSLVAIARQQDAFDQGRAQNARANCVDEGRSREGLIRTAIRLGGNETIVRDGILVVTDCEEYVRLVLSSEGRPSYDEIARRQLRRRMPLEP